MIKRINRTRRKRVTKTHIELSLRTTQGGEAPIFDLELKLSEYNFPPGSVVRVEAWRGNAVQRWDFGTVESLTPPPEEERRLTDVPMGAQFRILVVAGDESGRLLGHAPNIRPVLPVDSRLPLEESDQLGAQVWRVDFDGENGNPVLQVNSGIPGISEVVRSDAAFRSLVMPEVFRTILTRMVLIDQADIEDDDGPWADWFTIAQAYLPDAVPPAPLGLGPAPIEEIESAREWIDNVVAALAERPLDAASSYESAVRANST